jgi:hypothetical protein
MWCVGSCKRYFPALWRYHAVGRCAMILCDLCSESKRCRPRAIEGKEYEICSDCWNPLAKKLKGKGRVRKYLAKREMETILLPQQVTIPAPEAPQRLPVEPPKIWSRAEKLR